MPSVERVNWAKFRVSAVSAAALLILGTISALLTGGTLLEPKSKLYVFMPDATGVGPDSPVRVNGIGVGKVALVELTGSNQPERVVRVTMTIERNRLPSITEDSTAQTTSDNLIGDKFIDVESGTSEKHLAPGGEIHFKSSPELMKSIDLTQFQQPLRDIQALLDDIEKGQSPLGQFVMHDTLYNDVRQKITDLERAAQAAVQNTTAAGQALNTDLLYRQIVDPLRQLDQDLARFQSGQGTGAELLQDTKQYEQMRSQVAELRRSIANLHGAEILRSDASYQSWTRQLDAFIQQVDAMNAGPLLTTPAVYDNFNGTAQELEGTIKEFRDDPRKFLRIKIF
jgi:phospholipid/cholesterol/gamma-HCH transport system substrate-binding protein